MLWRIAQLPELAHLSERERGSLLQQSAGRAFTTRLVIRSLFVGLLAVFVVMFAMSMLRIAPNAAGQPYGGLIAVLLLACLAWVAGAALYYQYTLIRIRGQLRAYLRERQRLGEKPPVCLRCGYAIQEEMTHCPECGHAV